MCFAYVFFLGGGAFIVHVAVFKMMATIIYVIGAGSALLGKEAAMACTVAVETVITEHYDR